jgi:hypothetical protein
VSTNNPVYSSVSGILFNQPQTTLVEYPAHKAGTSYSIPNSVTSIGDGAFESCTKLTGVTIPNSVTSISSNAFEFSSLTHVTIGDGVINIEDWAFAYCYSLTNITFPGSVTTIGKDSFFNCIGLTGVTIPGSLTNIGAAAFAACGRLTTITVNTNNPSYAGVGGVLFNPRQTTLIQYPAGLVATSYAIPTGVTNIGDWAFFSCFQLTSVTIPNGVASIGADTFGDCNKLTSLTIPGSVTSIGEYAFAVTPLTSVYFQGNPPTTDGTMFNDDPNVYVYYLPDASGWSSTFAGAPAGVFNALSGFLQVTINPPSAVSSGAYWQMDGGIDNGSGVTVPNLSVGAHTVSFTPIAGWITPFNQSITITNGVTTWVGGIYTLSNAPSDSLVLITNGSGSIQHGAWPNGLVIGNTYKVTAVPRAKNVFTGWVGGTSQPYSWLSASPSYAFAMQSDLVLEANFVTNVFLAARGTYRGLFAPTSARRQENSGSFLFSLTSSGAVSGRLDLGGQTVPFSGKFDLGGAAEMAPKSEPSLTLTPQLDFANQSVSGTLSNSAFTAELTGNRDVFTSSDKATGFEGQYTLIIPGANDPAVGPYGVSYATVKVGPLGTITLAGSLADGTPISQSSVVSQDGYWPFYLNLYGGKGSLWGWNLFTNQTLTNAVPLSWINQTNSSKTAVYRSGFTNQQATLTGGLYLSGETLPSGLAVTLQDSNFAITVTNLSENTNKLTLRTNKTTGVISGSFANPDEPKQTIKINGVILAGQTNAQGYFLGTKQSGAFTLGPP